jgi:hypothetical protein
MDRHALAVLEAAESWGWPPVQSIQQSGEQGGSYKASTAKLLSCFIDASRAYPESTLVTQFWQQVDQLDSKFVRNSKIVFVVLMNLV